MEYRLHNLSPDELEQAERGPRFDDVKPSDIFGPKSSAALANTIRRLNAVRYRELREQYLYDSGQKKRPDSHFE